MATGAVGEVLVPDDRFHPFRYGFRYVRQVNAQGAEEWQQAPLTLDDVLHPHEGDVVIQNAPHARRCRYLADIFEGQLAGDPSAVVLNDVLVIWDVPDMKPHAPDITVILGVRQHKEWSRFLVADEGVRPALIVEVTSPSTQPNSTGRASWRSTRWSRSSSTHRRQRGRRRPDRAAEPVRLPTRVRRLPTARARRAGPVVAATGADLAWRRGRRDHLLRRGGATA